MKVLFVAGFSPIVADPKTSQGLYRKGLGLDLEQQQGDYVFTEKLPGVKHFGLWPLSEAARACYGKDEWPSDIPRPQAALEFEVDDVDAVARDLESKQHRLIHGMRTEPWGQVIARLLSPEGLLIGVCHTPWLHETAPT